MPKNFSVEEAWAFLKFSRQTNQELTPVKDKNGDSFRFAITKSMYQKLSHIDSNTSGFLSSEWGKTTEAKKSQLIISGLSEEAIASSQIEGASTSRRVAKEMLLEIQENITRDTLKDSDDSGRFRNDDDDIHIVDSVRNKVVFTPPKKEVVEKELDRLIEFANNDEKDEEFIHPVVKATIIHFWLSYLHPFVDGNGRTARALFYWYLLKKNYWLFQYLSVSRAIKLSRVQYDDSFLKTELDDNDLTYFVFYQLSVIKTL